MTRREVNYFVIFILTVGIGFIAWTYYKLVKENKDLKFLLSKAVLSVDRDSKHIYNELVDIIGDTSYDKQYPEIKTQRIMFDSIYKLHQTFDTTILTKELIEATKNKLLLNDSLIKFSSRFNICGFHVSKMLITEYFEHEAYYNYGDTATFVFNLNTPPYLLENNFEIIDFTRKEFGSQKQNCITYKIPTSQLLTLDETPKLIKFDFKIITKNNYTNQLDTLFLWTDLTVFR